MSKRFPVPEFAREELKNLDWSAPVPIGADERASRLAGSRDGDAAVCGAFVVDAEPALFDRLAFAGAHRCALMCVSPAGRDVRLLGRSFAWAIQRAVVIDSLDTAGCNVIVDWRTPRPMNTRLGPDEGVTMPGGVVYALLGHRHADRWIANRVLVDNDHRAGPGQTGFRILSAHDDRINDFHACNLTFTWPA